MQKPKASAKVDQTSTKMVVEAIAGMDKKVRRKTLREIGTAVTKLQLPVMRSLWNAQGRNRTGALGKSFGRKVSLNRDHTRLTAMVGPRRGTKTKGVLRRRTYAVFRKTKAGLVPVRNRKGKQLIRQPTRYAHLAGPRRRSTFVQQTAKQTASQVKQIMVTMLKDALARK